MKRIALCLLAGMLVSVVATDAVAERSSILSELEDSFVRLHEEVRPSVVNIETETRIEEDMGGGMEDLFRFFGVPIPEGPQQQTNPNPNPGRVKAPVPASSMTRITGTSSPTITWCKRPK